MLKFLEGNGMKCQHKLWVRCQMHSITSITCCAAIMSNEKYPRFHSVQKKEVWRLLLVFFLLLGYLIFVVVVFLNCPLSVRESYSLDAKQRPWIYTTSFASRWNSIWFAHHLAEMERKQVSLFFGSKPYFLSTGIGFSTCIF